MGLSFGREPYLPDDRVMRHQERAWLRHPVLAKYDAMFATALVEPPYEGQLPDGTTGRTTHPLVQFIVASSHPRPIQRRMGIQHVNVAIAWRRAWDGADKERGHYVQGGAPDPAGTIFDKLAEKHARDLLSLESIIDR